MRRGRIVRALAGHVADPATRAAVATSLAAWVGVIAVDLHEPYGFVTCAALGGLCGVAADAAINSKPGTSPVARLFAPRPQPVVVRDIAVDPEVAEALSYWIAEALRRSGER